MPFMRGMELAAIALALRLENHTAIADVVPVVSSKSAIGALSKSQVADIFLVRPPISLRASKLYPSTKSKARPHEMSSVRKWQANHPRR